MKFGWLRDPRGALRCIIMSNDSDRLSVKPKGTGLTKQESFILAYKERIAKEHAYGISKRYIFLSFKLCIPLFLLPIDIPFCISFPNVCYVDAKEFSTTINYIE